ncbi:MAG TPA: DUF6438 domain-containing protein [Pseudoxanthomonas sp.]|nr:DUF6438 domain-containing protein [Pseudoxanthomonas sp.]
MHLRTAVLLLGLGVLCACKEPPRADTLTRVQATEPLPGCTPGQLIGLSPSPEQVTAHRQFDAPTLKYAQGQHPKEWGFPLVLLVDASGHAVCYEMDDADGRAVALNPQRKALLVAARQWRYRPFMEGDKASVAVVHEPVAEERIPPQRRVMPEVPLDTVKISLSRSGCYGTCPIYSVEVFGDGRVIYDGEQYVDVTGRHEYRIPVEQVRDLLATFRRSDAWSLESNYSAMTTDSPTYCLRIHLDGQEHVIQDYVGKRVGMPQVVRQLQDAVDRISRAREWTELSQFAVAQLQQEGFDFTSQAGANLFANAVMNYDGQDEAAMLRLIALGTPLQGGLFQEWRQNGVASEYEMFMLALSHHRVALIAPMLERGLLLTRGRVDQAKLDEAFQSAIEGGRLAAVQAIWNYSDTMKPSLHYVEPPASEGADPTERYSVLMRLQRLQDPAWEGQQIAAWLATQGADLRSARGARGETLLHVAVQAEDFDFVRYLLAQGLDVSAESKSGLPALGGAHTEDMAMLLLQAGSSWEMGDGGKHFRDYAGWNHWGRVLAWTAPAAQPGAK